MKEYSIIDCHCHIYPDGIVSKAVEAIESFYDNRYKGADGRIETMRKNGEASGVEGFIVFSVATTPHQVHSINNFIAECVEKSGGVFTGLGALHPDSEALQSDFDELCSLGLRGVKLHPDIQKIAIDDERMKRIYRLCEGKLPVLLHTGDYRYDFSNPDRMKRILDEFPGCTFIGAHLGGWSVWDEAVGKLSGYPNFYVDTSSCLCDISPEKFSELIEKYTPDKVLFGTDYPLGDVAGEIEVIRNSVKDEESLEKIFYKNAQMLFNL